MTTAATNRQILYAHRPDSQLTPDAFKTVESPLPEPAPGEVLCRTILLSIDAANRAWMQGRTYRDQLQEGEVMAGFGLSEVIAENDAGIPVGSVVLAHPGWQEYAALPAREVNVIRVVAPLTNHLSVLGGSGLTAYFGLLRIGQPQAGDTILVSAAAGSTGNIVGQIAKVKGCFTVGLAGSDTKCSLLVDELGFDAAVNYRSETFKDDLRAACPAGVDVYFDNVGGPVLQRALRVMNGGGRIVCCGAVSQYDTDDPTGGAIYGIPGLIVTKRLRMEGFIVSDFADDWPAALQDLASWVASGQVRVLEDVLDGLERAPAALIGLLAGDNVGKRMVRVAPDPGV